MNQPSRSDSQTMHSTLSSYDPYAAPVPAPLPGPHPSTFDDFLCMQPQSPPHLYDHSHFGVLPHHFPDIPPATSFHSHPFAATRSNNDRFIGYNHHCARMDAFASDKNIRNGMEMAPPPPRRDYNAFPHEYNPTLPPIIDHAQSIEPHHSFCSDTSNATSSTIASNYSLFHQPPPIYHFPSDYKNVSNQVYPEDDLSSTSCTSFNGSIKQSPSLRSDHSYHTLKTEAPNVMLLTDASSVARNSKKKAQNANAKPWVCPECGNRYKYKSSMKLHFKVHTKDAKICKECGKKFPHQHKLNIHMRSHTGERPYKCDLCDKAFSDKSNLNRHKRLHTGEKPYQCEYCQRRYSDSSALVDHRRRKHTKEKPYKCQFCSKMFAASSDLTSHLAVHSNIRPFACETCGKRFKRRSDVHKHMKTHQPKVGNKRV
eukprot:174345_1